MIKKCVHIHILFSQSLLLVLSLNGALTFLHVTLTQPGELVYYPCGSFFYKMGQGHGYIQG